MLAHQSKAPAKAPPPALGSLPTDQQADIAEMGLSNAEVSLVLGALAAQSGGAGGGDAAPAADSGPVGTQGAMPYQDKLQNSFGTDFSGIRATIGGKAGADAAGKGMAAAADGTDVTFAATPTLWLAAHEAAHTALGHKGGDNPQEEAEADAIADKVAAGGSVKDRVDVKKAMGTQGVAAYKVKGKLKVGSTGQVATDSGQGLWASDSRIDEANQKLKGAGKDGSFIRLNKGSDTKKIGSKRLNVVEPTWVSKGSKDGMHGKVSSVNAGDQADSEGETSGPMALWSDCGRSSGAVTGSKGGDREVVYQKDGKTKTSSGQMDNSVSGWLRTEPGGMANAIYMDNLPAFIRKTENAAFLTEGVHYRTVKYTGFQGWIAGVLKKPTQETKYLTPKTIVEAKSMYAALGEDGRDKFDKEAGINHYANPEIGQTYSMATEGDMPGFKEKRKNFTWNYHWAGVVMKDGSDNVSLENYAVTGEYAKSKGVQQGEFVNREWNFDMYGTEDKDQTFHEAHLDSGTHGTHATSIAVQAKKK
jgi:hypothetical protein